MRTRFGFAMGVAAVALSLGQTATGVSMATATAHAGHAATQKPGYYDSESFIGSSDHELLESYVRDSHGRTSAVMNVGTKPFGHHSLQYLLREHGATRWSKRRVAGSGKLGLTAYDPEQLVASLSGNRLYLLISTRDGLYVTSKSAAAKNFPRLTGADLKIPASQVTERGDDGIGAIAGTHRLDILALTQPRGTDVPELTLFQIHPSRSLTRRSLLNGQCPEFEGAVITRDPVTGWLTVVAQCDANQAAGRVLVWVRHSSQGAQFDGPKQLAPDDRHAHYEVTSLASIDNHVYIGLGGADVRIMIHGTVSANGDHWTRPHVFQHTRIAYKQPGLLLAVAPRLGLVHAAYASGGCLETTTLKPGPRAHWSTPTCDVRGSSFLFDLVATNGRGTRLAYLR